MVVALSAVKGVIAESTTESVVVRSTDKGVSAGVSIEMIGSELSI